MCLVFGHTMIHYFFRKRLAWPAHCGIIMATHAVKLFFYQNCCRVSHCHNICQYHGPSIAPPQCLTHWLANQRAFLSTSVTMQGKQVNTNRVEKRLQRLLEKKKKKFSFEAVSYTQLGKLVKPPPSAKSAKVMGPEESIKLKTYNSILHENISDLINSNYISEELQDLQVSVLGVRLTGDMSTCRVYWQASGNYAVDQSIQDVLDFHASKIRHALINLRVLGKIPRITFLQEKTAARKAEVERLLESVDLGPESIEDSMEEENVDESSIEGKMMIPDDSASDRVELEPILGLNQREIQKHLAKIKSQGLNQLHEFDDSTEGSMQKFRNSIKRRKKGREKGLYDAGNFSAFEEFDGEQEESFQDDIVDEREVEEEMHGGGGSDKD